MKLKIIITSIFLFVYILINGQQIEVQVVYNNTAEMISNAEAIKKIRSAVKTFELQTALNSNNHITDKNLKIRIAFFDRGVIGQLKLKTEHELTPEKYIEKWQESVKNQSGILFLFVRSKGGTDYTFNKMAVSSRLEEEHLFPKVTEFINENLKGDIMSIVENGTKYLSRAITPVWTEEKKAEALLLVNNGKYKANHINLFHDWFGFAFFDLRPGSADETKDMKLINCMTKKEGGKWFVSDKYIYTNKNNLKGYSSNKFYEWDITFEEDGIRGIYIFYDQFLYNILTVIENSGKHNPDQIASSWGWEYKSKYERSIYDLTHFRDRKEDDRLILYFDESYKNKEGQEISILSQSYGSTWCNVFACDLANEVLFGKIFGDIHNGPWGTHHCANRLHWRISHDNQNFKEVEINNEIEKDAWDYTRAGYVVYLTAFGKGMNEDTYLNKSTESDIPMTPSGHIATCFNKDTKSVIQAGRTTGEVSWNTAQKAHVYLGYIIK